jgi:hypothetical protein
MKHDYLDDTIDAVAARMTRVEENDALATRILAALPERSPWILHSWIPRLAITAAIAIGVSLVVLRPFGGRSADVLRAGGISSGAVEMAAAVPEHRTNGEPAQAVRGTIVEPPENDRGTVVDFERSLPAIVAMHALQLDSLAPVSLPEDAPLTLKPLAIDELPLTAETISPR